MGSEMCIRDRETIIEAFAYLEKLQRDGILGARVMKALKQLAASGCFDGIIAEARGRRITASERQLLRRMER